MIHADMRIRRSCKRRTNSTDLSYDYVMVKGGYAAISNLPSSIRTAHCGGWARRTWNRYRTFFDNAVYLGHGPICLESNSMALSPSFEFTAIFGITNFNHNIDRGKVGIILDADTADYFESTFIEVDASGSVLKRWNMANIISAAMIAGGDDPSQFVYPTPTTGSISTASPIIARMTP